MAPPADRRYNNTQIIIWSWLVRYENSLIKLIIVAKIIIAFLVFLLFACQNSKRKGTWLTPSSFLLLIYTLSIFMSIIDIPLNGDVLVTQEKYWLPSIEMWVMLLAFLYPFQRFNESKVEDILVPGRQFLDVFSGVIIVLSLYSILWYFPTVMNLLRGDLGALRNALYAGEEYVETGIFNTIASTSASLYVFSLLLFFIYLCIGGSKWRLILLFISSMSEPIHVLSFVGRDGIVFWIFAVTFLFLVFKPYIQTKKIDKIKKYGILVGTVLLIPFVMISVGRFGDQEGGTFNAIVNYLGQPYVYGTLYFGIDNPPVDVGHSFPLFYEFTGMKLPESTGKWEEGGTVSWVFGTFLKSWYESFGGWFGLILCCIACAVIFFSVFCKVKKVLPMNKLFVYIVYFQVFAQGVFYFRQYTRGGNLFIIICFLFAIAFKAKPNRIRIRKIQSTRVVS